MNVYDSTRMADLLAPLGYRLVAASDEADLVILNTCHIREKAAEKVYSELGRLRVLKTARAETGGRMVVAVGGCVAQAEGAEILRRAPHVDIVFGPQTYHRLPDLVARVLLVPAAVAAKGLLDTEFPAETKFDLLPETASPQGVAAILSVQEGCDKFCSFCVVPYTRGAEYSRPAGDVLREARDLDDALVAAHRDVPQLMPFLHLPVQSGSDRVLAAMNRKHTADAYRRLIERFRTARAD